MIVVDGCNPRRDRINHVRRIEAATEPSLDNRDVHSSPRKVRKGECRGCLEERRAEGFDQRCPAFHELDDLFSADAAPIDDDALAEINEVRRCVRSDAKPFAAEQGLGSRDATSLPVRAGDVDARISVMRIAERREKGDRPLEAKLERSGRTGEEVLERLRVSRVSCARRQRYGRRCSRQGELHPVTAGRPDIWRSSWPTVRLRFRRCTTESSIP